MNRYIQCIHSKSACNKNVQVYIDIKMDNVHCEFVHRLFMFRQRSGKDIIRVIILNVCDTGQKVKKMRIVSTENIGVFVPYVMHSME